MTKLECAAKAMKDKAKDPITFENAPSGEKMMLVGKAAAALVK